MKHQGSPGTQSPTMGAVFRLSPLSFQGGGKMQLKLFYGRQFGVSPILSNGIIFLLQINAIAMLT